MLAWSPRKVMVGISGIILGEDPVMVTRHQAKAGL